MATLNGGVSAHSFIGAWTDWVFHLAGSPGRQLQLAEHAQRNLLLLIACAAQARPDAVPPFAPKAYDHRFRHAGWQTQPFRMWQQMFLSGQDWWDHATDHLHGLTRQDADRTRFIARQAMDVVSPSNFPLLNPEILEATLASCGQNFADGCRHLAHDVRTILIQAPESPPEGFRVGQDLAATPGTVVFRNEMFELIQYAPQTDEVRAEPILIVPAWIMKYYVLDLSASNSMVRHLVARGHTVFMISWRNPTSAQADWSLEDYRRDGVMAALQQVTHLNPGRKVHAVGYCLGGTMLAIAVATMARDGDDRLASVTLMAAQIDFAEAGELLLFVDESQVSLLEDLMAVRGFLDRPQMGRTFSSIRSEDLIWTRAVRRYLLGEEDAPTDMGVWLADLTRMPARMHSEYLRALFLENRLTAGRFAVEGRVIALKDISVPVFVVATETDHIAPWRSVYKTQLFTDGDLTFVLTSGGHNSGIVNPPGTPRSRYRWSHRPAHAPYRGPDDWLDQAMLREGSWWPSWTDWLDRHGTGRLPAPGPVAQNLGDAPGTYVHQT